MPNSYFQSLPAPVQSALGKAAYDAFINFPPSFAWHGNWQNIDEEVQARWCAVAESIMVQLQGLDEFVTTKLQIFNEAQRVTEEAIKRFEAIRPDDAGFNNYQLLEWLRSAHAEIVNARLLMLRADIIAGNVNASGDGSTQKVYIPNVKSE